MSPGLSTRKHSARLAVLCGDKALHFRVAFAQKVQIPPTARDCVKPLKNLPVATRQLKPSKFAGREGGSRWFEGLVNSAPPLELECQCLSLSLSLDFTALSD